MCIKLKPPDFTPNNFYSSVSQSEKLTPPLYLYMYRNINIKLVKNIITSKRFSSLVMC